MPENICKFIQTKNVSEDINILCFVFEAEAKFKQKFIIPAANTVALVVNGSGVLHTSYDCFPLHKDQLFFTFAAKPYYIENTGNLQYIYISFVGLRAQALLNRTGVTPTNPVYSDCGFLGERWQTDLARTSENNIDIVCESLLLHTLSYLCVTDEEDPAHNFSDSIIKLKEYVDSHYTEQSLNLSEVSKRFNYSPKYVSAAFIRLVKCPFSVYVKQLRMKHSETLIAQGLNNVKEIANASGYNDPLYFSKTFSKYFGISPKKYAKQKHIAIQHTEYENSAEQ